MKAVVLHEYGPPKNLKYEDFKNPTPDHGDVIVRVAAAGVNPVDWKIRSGAAKERFPQDFPAILGRDVAGTIQSLGEGVSGYSVGDQVFALTWHTYADLCAVSVTDLARVPDNLELTMAAAVPLVACTGDQLMRRGAKAQAGQTILLTGALGSVGRIAFHCAKEIGVRLIAGVRKQQIEEAKSLGAVDAIDLDDDDSINRLGTLDAVADTVGGKIAPRLLDKIKSGGYYGSVLGPPQGAEQHPSVQINAFMAQPDTRAIVHYAEAIRDGKLVLPIGLVLPLSEATEAHIKGEKGGVGKIVLTP